MSDEIDTVEDGQHKGEAAYQTKNIEFGDVAARLLYNHVLTCSKAPLLTPDLDIKFGFCMTDKPGIANVLCGFCNKELGTCTLKEVP